MKNHIYDISKSIEEKRLSFFCGAGISWNSGIPLANELKHEILNKLPIDKKDIDEIMNSNLPFEAFIEVISKSTNISKILDIFKDGNPNTNHNLIASLAKHNFLKTIVTTNFDLLIEKALENEGLKRDDDFKVYYDEDQLSDINFEEIKDDKIVRIFKIHGSIENKDSIRTTLKAVAKKSLSDKRKGLIKYLFSTGNHQKVLIIGYSCSDEFDITPQIQSIKENQKEIIFIEHSNIEQIEDIKIKDQKNPFKKFQGERIKCDTDTFIKQLWNFLKEHTGEYEHIKSMVGWKSYVHDWADGIGKNKISVKLKSKVVENIAYIIPIEKNIGYFKYFITALLFTRISNYIKAIEFYEKSVVIAKEINDRAGEASCYGNLGVNYFGLTHFKRAGEYQKKALEIYKEIGDKKEQAICYTGLGNVYLGLGEFEVAIECYENSLKLYQEIEDKEQEAHCYGNMGHVYSELKNTDKAMLNYHNSLEIANTIGDKEEELKCYIGIGNVYCYLGSFKYKVETVKHISNYEAIDYFMKALEIIKVLGHKVGELSCYIGLGNVFHNLNNFREAITYYEKALEISKEIKDKHAESACHTNLGSIYFNDGNVDRGMEYYLNAEKIFKDTGQKYRLKNLYNNLVYFFEKVGDYENAEKYKQIATSNKK